MSLRRSVGAAAAALALLGSALAGAVLVGPAGAARAAPAAGAGDKPAWGPVGVGIFPGVRTVTAGAFCTANFVFYDSDGEIYLGQAAHCARKQQEEVANPSGCTFASHPLGTPVTFEASRVRGELAYSGWLAMQERGETDPSACKDNDFALVRVPKFARKQVNPTMPLFGGPTGLNTDGTRPGDPVAGYGNSPTRMDISDLQPKQGVSVGTVDDGWAHLVYTLTPGIPGDSGGPYLDAQGRALGSLATMVLEPAPAANSITDIAKALAYAQEHSGIDGLKLAKGTEPFQGASILAPLLNQATPPPMPPPD